MTGEVSIDADTMHEWERDGWRLQCTRCGLVWMPHEYLPRSACKGAKK